MCLCEVVCPRLACSGMTAWPPLFFLHESKRRPVWKRSLESQLKVKSLSTEGFYIWGGGWVGWIGAGWGGVKLLLIGLSCRSRWSAGSWFSCACGPLFSESYISYFYDHFLYCICVFFRLVCSLCWHLWVLINGWEVSSKTSMRSRKEHLLIHNILSFNSVLIWLTRSWNYLNAQASRNPFVSPSSPCMEFLTKTVFQV